MLLIRKSINVINPLLGYLGDVLGYHPRFSNTDRRRAYINRMLDLKGACGLRSTKRSVGRTLILESQEKKFRATVCSRMTRSRSDNTSKYWSSKKYLLRMSFVLLATTLNVGPQNSHPQSQSHFCGRWGIIILTPEMDK